ncbi:MULTISPECIES: cyanophycin metabolism-associated DUF1854 family protein [Undibacterium]|jgi:hypothetical protein|uniref:DUF1854 domain-containing protein n=1 Tax=Undibacterium umbellatum TaxID=2762300 RepID=A0ABR6Z4U8_9BURK|nr:MULTISPECIES: DUF1854 domain-containing protein [Undibacterium]MBC3906579.1 DUF1854 domain-containing protein [Undibacterium umbellatum]MDP1980451.1 DUF1854 domain-containing protein [Undibacterium sp.]
MTTTKFTLTRNSFGKLILSNEAGEVFEGVSPVRAFPIQSPLAGMSLVMTDGREVAWIDQLDDLAVDVRALVMEELEGREFMPEISSIISVTSFALPCTWTVATDRGETDFVLKGDEDIRRIGKTSLLITDNHGIQFLIRDMYEIDKHSRKILDRFL